MIPTYKSPSKTDYTLCGLFLLNKTKSKQKNLIMIVNNLN